MRRAITAATLAALLFMGQGVALASPGPHGKKFVKTHGGCRTWKCVNRVHKHYWSSKQKRLPGETKAMLARLRGCETRGIPYPQNYRWKGHHRGAYQYTFSTWARAGGSGDPADASPAEQDVRTANFYPSHRGEWECSG